MSVRPTSRTPDEPASAAIRERTIGILCGFGVVALFSGFTLVSRLGFSSSLTLPDIAALRFGIGGLLLLPIVLRHGLSGLSWRHAIALAFLGGLGFALFAYAGFSLAPAAHGAVLLHGTLPLFTFAITAAIPAAIPGRKATPAKTLGVAMITAGIVVMALDSLLGATAGQLLGDASLLLASVCWASYGILARRLGIPPARAASVVAVLSMCCFLPIYLAMPGKALLSAGWHEILVQGVFQGVFIGAVSIFIYTRAVSALGASETALFTAAVPCVTTIAAVPLLSEMPSTAGMIGVAVVTAGMVVAMQRA